MKYTFYAVVLSFFFFAQVQAQPGDDYQGRLYRLCKVWGYVKYHHTAVSNCRINWDSVLVATIPLVKAATDSNQFNAAVFQMLNAAGTMDAATTQPVLPQVNVNTDSSWIDDPYFSPLVHSQLDYIRQNFRPHDICFVRNNDFSDSTITGWLVFPGDTFINITSSNPPEPVRLLILFKQWNVLNYFNPNSHILDDPWDSTLARNVLLVANASGATQFYKAMIRVVSKLDDAHAGGLTYSNHVAFPGGYYMPPFVLSYIENKYVVVKSNDPSIHKGDIVDSVEGLTTMQWEDSLRPYISVGNPSVFHREISWALLSGSNVTQAHIVYTDSIGVSRSVIMDRTVFFGDWYAFKNADTSVEFKTIGCNIGYVDMGNLLWDDVQTMYDSLQNKSAIIFDVRNYPQGTVFEIAPLMFASPKPVANFLVPDVTYPGGFNWQTDSFGVVGNPKPYNGRVIILMNEETQSHAEYTCMILSQNQNVVKIGSQTAGADGNVTKVHLSEDLNTGFTSLGTYYPNGVNTQRIGIVPDIVVKPTIAGIRHGIDEVLDSAIYIACNTTGVKEIKNNPDISLYPNPANRSIVVSVNNSKGLLNLKIQNAFGQVLRRDIIDGTKMLDISGFSSGIYLLSIYGEDGVLLNTIKWMKYE